MTFSGINYLAVLIGAVAAFGFGFLWHMIFARPWMTEAGFSAAPKPALAPFLVAFLAEVVLAWTLAGTIGHVGPVTVRNAVVSAIFLWAGFIVTTMIVDHSFEARPKRLTLLNAGHWLGVVLIIAVVVGAFGA